MLLPIQIRKGLWPELFENRPAASPTAQSLQGNSKNFHPIIQGGIITDERKTDTTAAGGQGPHRCARSESELQEVKGLLLGKQGALTGLLKELPRLDVSLRPEMGKAVNQAKTQLTELLEAKREELKLKASEVDPDFDITVPGTAPLSGGLHPITQMCYDLNDAFRSMALRSSRSPTSPASCMASTT